jgi:SHS2 domain-containing protein
MRDTPADAERETMLAEGVRALDHTADVGFDVVAPSMDALFDRAARGLVALLHGEDRAAGGPPRAPRPQEGSDETSGNRPDHAAGTTSARRVVVEAPDIGALLVAWLRELLWLHESAGFVYDGARFEALAATALVADVRGATGAPPAAREIKGVTYHGLDVGRTDGDWHARVIFDV